MDYLVGYHDYSVLVSLSLIHCIGLRGDDVAEALATICVTNTKLRRVRLEFISPLPVMRLLGTRQVPLEELEINLPGVC